MGIEVSSGSALRWRKREALRVTAQTTPSFVARHAWMFIHLILAPNPRSHEAPRRVTAFFNTLLGEIDGSLDLLRSDGRSL